MFRSAIILLPVFALTAGGCSDVQRTFERTALLGSPGPQITEATAEEQAQVIAYLRRFGPTYVYDPQTPDAPAPALTTEMQLLAARSAAFAFIDTECDAYLDAIFWANRTRNTITRSTALIGSATTGIMAITGAGSVGIAAAAAAFGLASSLVDSYYETFLYALEPSGVMGLVEKAQNAYRTSDALAQAPANEGELLGQVHGYIRQCAPPKIEALVNQAIARGEVKPADRAVEPLTPEEVQRVAELIAKDDPTIAEKQELVVLFRRLTLAGIAAPAPDAPADGDGDGDGDTDGNAEAAEVLGTFESAPASGEQRRPPSTSGYRVPTTVIAN